MFPLDVSDRRYLSMRVAQDTTTGEDLAMRVTLTGANGTSSASIVVDDQVVEIPPQDNQVFTRTVMRTIRIPLACFLAENPDLGLEDLTSVELEMLSDNRAGVMDDLGFQY